MNRTSSALAWAACVAIGLLLGQLVGAQLLGTFGLSEYLFADDATRVFALLAMIAVVFCRVLLAFALPAYVAALALSWFWARRARR